MKTTIKDISVFVKNNPQHFKDLHPLVKQYLDSFPVQSCGFCPKAIKPTDNSNTNFKNLLLCNSEIAKLIIDKCKILLDDVVEIEDFSVNDCGESDKNK